MQHTRAFFVHFSSRSRFRFSNDSPFPANRRIDARLPLTHTHTHSLCLRSRLQFRPRSLRIVLCDNVASLLVSVFRLGERESANGKRKRAGIRKHSSAASFTCTRARNTARRALVTHVQRSHTRACVRRGGAGRGEAVAGKSVKWSDRVRSRVHGASVMCARARATPVCVHATLARAKRRAKHMSFRTLTCMAVVRPMSGALDQLA